MLRLRYLALLAAAACSPVKDASNVPDAPIDSTDTSPPMIASSVPEDMATKVSILSPISVFFDEGLDPASVTADTVKLSYEDTTVPQVVSFGLVVPHGPLPSRPIPIAGTVTYNEAAKKVSFVPTVPLPYGRVLTLALDVKDHAGLAFTGGVRFMTYVNGVTNQFFFSSAGVPTSWIGFPTDMAGRQTKRISGNAPGNDTIWFSADDPRSSRYEFKYKPDGGPLEERYFSAGTDGKYDTPDDPITNCITYAYDQEQRLAERTYANVPGPDGMWCTADDIPVVNTVYSRSDGALTGYIYNTDPGADNTWHTSDDTCAVYYDFEYDAQGNKTREVYRDCSGDGFAHTADDAYNYYYQYEYDASGRVARNTFYVDPGADTQWLTDDDLINRVERYVYNTDGQLTETFVSFDPGVDMMWGTLDDTGRRMTQTYNAQKLVEDITTYGGLGADGMWGTDDDVIIGYSKLTYDANGNRTDEKEFSIGADNMWKTPDDRVSVDYEFDLGK